MWCVGTGYASSPLLLPSPSNHKRFRHHGDRFTAWLPLHILNVIKNEKRQVDEFDDITLMIIDFVDFNQFMSKFQDAREAVSILSKLFSRFD